METEMETDYCDICGRICDGAHGINKNTTNKTNEQKIQQIVNILVNYDENMINEIIKRVYEKKSL
jgi:hypothetical protein